MYLTYGVVIKAILLVAILITLSVTGCVLSLHPPKQSVLSADEAAVLAAKFANDECERLYRKRLFYPELYKAELKGTTWHWGRLDPAGPHGFSAKVSFNQDTSNPVVEDYYSEDTIRKQRHKGEPVNKEGEDLFLNSE